MPPRIFTDAQVELLKSKLPQLLELQASKRSLTEFWESTMHAYFEANCGPESDYQPPAPTIKLTKKGKESKRQVKLRVHLPTVYPTLQAWKDDRTVKVKDWFNNTTNKGKRAQKPAVQIVVSATSTKRTRMLTHEQLYSKMFYEDRVKSVVEDRLKNEQTEATRIKITSEVVSEKWKKEADWVKEAVKKEHLRLAKEKKERERQLGEILEKDGDQLSPEECAIFQDAIPTIFESLFDTLQSKTGMVFTVIGGGPHVAKTNGPIDIFSYHLGKGDATFYSTFPELDHTISKSFGAYCHRVFPEADRLRRCITVNEATVVSVDALAASGRAHGRLMYADGAGAGTDQAQTKSSEVPDANGGDGNPESGAKKTGASDESDDSESEEEERKRRRKRTSKKGRRGGHSSDSSESEDEGEGNTRRQRGGKGRKKRRDRRDASDESDSDSAEEARKRKKAKQAKKRANDNDTDSGNDGGGTRSKKAKKGKGRKKHISKANLASTDDEVPLEDPAGRKTPTAPPVPGQAPVSLPPSLSLPPPAGFTAMSVPNGGWNAQQNSGFQYPWMIPPASQPSGGGLMLDPEHHTNYEPLDGRGVDEVSGGGLMLDPEHHTNYEPLDGRGVDEVSGGGLMLDPEHHTNYEPLDGRGVDEWQGFQEMPPNPPGWIPDGLPQGVLMMDLVNDALGVQVGWVGGVGAPANEWEQLGKETRGDTGTDAGQQSKHAMGFQHDERKGGKEVEEQMMSEGGMTGSKEREGGEDIGDERGPQPRKSGRDRSMKTHQETPEWLDQVHGYLVGASTDPEWQACIASWMSFEKRVVIRGGAGNGRVNVASRPKELTAWLQGGRQFDSVPQLQSVDSFREAWLLWWAALANPEKKGSKGAAPGGMDVSGIRKGGLSGINSVLISLAWWAHGGSKSNARKWKETVGEVGKAFAHFVPKE